MEFLQISAGILAFVPPPPGIYVTADPARIYIFLSRVTGNLLTNQLTLPICRYSTSLYFETLWKRTRTKMKQVRKPNFSF